MSILRHDFTREIISILDRNTNGHGEFLLQSNELTEESIEEIINIPRLIDIFEQVLASGKGIKVIKEIVLQSRIEFNIETEEQDVLTNKDEVIWTQ